MPNKSCADVRSASSLRSVPRTVWLPITFSHWARTRCKDDRSLPQQSIHYELSVTKLFQHVYGNNKRQIQLPVFSSLLRNHCFDFSVGIYCKRIGHGHSDWTRPRRSPVFWRFRKRIEHDVPPFVPPFHRWEAFKSTWFCVFTNFVWVKSGKPPTQILTQASCRISGPYRKLRKRAPDGLPSCPPMFFSSWTMCRTPASTSL